MSRDIDIFASRAGVIPQQEIISALQDRGLAVQWQTDPFVTAFSRPSRKRPWRAAQLLPEGDEASGSGIDITNQQFDAESLASLKEALSDRMDASTVQVLERACVRYQVSSGWIGNRLRDRLMFNAADVLAELGDGVILDNATNRFHDRAKFRSRHRAYLAQRSGRRRPDE